jgi:dTDP-4-dehydrorhamnose reductase
LARVLVFGGGGWVGQALVPALVAAGHEVTAPGRAHADVTDGGRVVELAVAIRPHVVVNLAARMPGSAPATLTAVNEDGARNVALAAAATGARLVHLSSDAVLDGESAPYADDAPARPVSAYGRSKAAGEAAALAACPNALAVRTSLSFDPALPDPSTSRFIARLAAGERCRLYVDEIRCPLPRAVLAAALSELASSDVRGRLNVAGTQALSRYAFVTLLLEHFGVAGRERVERARVADSDEPRARDVTLDVSRARSLLVTRLPAVRETLAREAGNVLPPSREVP